MHVNPHMLSQGKYEEEKILHKKKQEHFGKVNNQLVVKLTRRNRRTGPFPFGEHNIFARISNSLAQKSNMFGAMHFCCTWGGGGGGGARRGILLFCSDWV